MLARRLLANSSIRTNNVSIETRTNFCHSLLSVVESISAPVAAIVHFNSAPEEVHMKLSHRSRSATIVLVTIAALMSTVACSHKPQSVNNSPAPRQSSVVPTAYHPASQKAQPVVVATPEPIQTKASPKPITYKSRDYGVSFVYPWQYSYTSAKSIANSGDSLKPKSDGDEGQFVLARIDVPKGFYPDTNFERGYFTLSLNQDLDEAQCASALGVGDDGQVKTDSINGVTYKWVETESGGSGSAATVRNYSAYVNDTCYEVELGVKTRSDQGLAREVDPDQVMRKLNSILKTVQIVPEKKPAAQQVASSVPSPEEPKK